MIRGAESLEETIRALSADSPPVTAGINDDIDASGTNLTHAEKLYEDAKVGQRLEAWLEQRWPEPGPWER